MFNIRMLTDSLYDGVIDLWLNRVHLWVQSKRLTDSVSNQNILNVALRKIERRLASRDLGQEDRMRK